MIQTTIFILGIGAVGQTLLKQISATRRALAQRAGLQLIVAGVADSEGMLLETEGLTSHAIASALDTKAAGRKLSSLPASRSTDELPGALGSITIVVDTTASTETRPLLLNVLQRGGGVVLANKHPVGGPLEQARAFLQHPRVRMEATVGAGLPVIQTLNTLGDTGDRVANIDGCLSGTLGYLCGELEEGVPFSEAVSKARKKRFTEPDPREDLSGRDVARKAIIMGRVAGWELEMTDLSVEALYAEELAGMGVEEFLIACGADDQIYAKRVADAKAKGQVLRYAARVGPDGGTVGLMAVDQSSLLGALRGPGNYVALHTARYNTEPLVISGPGAGLEVTAAGILGDIVALSQSG